MYVGGGIKFFTIFFKANEYSWKLSELKELSPYVRFIFIFSN